MKTLASQPFFFVYLFYEFYYLIYIIDNNIISFSFIKIQVKKWNFPIVHRANFVFSFDCCCSCCCVCRIQEGKRDKGERII